jgi:hypothetical protein
MSCCYLIHFWMVEYQHANRVMRQFGKYQEVPPPPPLAYDQISYLREAWRHDGNSTMDGCWALTHKSFIEMDPVLIREHRPYEMSMHHQYINWFYLHGMSSVYISDNNPQDLHRLAPPRTGDVETLAYVPHGHRHSRVVRTLIFFKIEIQNYIFFSILICNMSYFFRVM